MMQNFQTIPFDRIVKFGQISMLEGVFNISWILGRFCNYKCSYCWPYANTDTYDFQSVNLYKTVVDKIITQANANNFYKFHWSFSGGEPTTYKHLSELLTHITTHTNNQHSIHMTTNLSPSINYWKKWIKETVNFNRKSITASFHHEFADEETFSNKILFLMSNDVLVTINQVMVPAIFWQIYERCQRFRSKGINVTLKPQSNSDATSIVSDYTDEMLNIMQSESQQHINLHPVYQIKLIDNNNNSWYIDQAERFNAFSFNKFTDWRCVSGYQSCVIRGNEVKRGYSCHDTILGTLEDFKLFSEVKPCMTKSCVSSADSKIPKCK